MINLKLRYPDSKPEDITDAYNRGVLYGMAVGRETCTDVGRYCFRCSACDWCSNEPRLIFGAGFWANYCPNCGRKVVDDASVD